MRLNLNTDCRCNLFVFVRMYTCTVLGVVSHYICTKQIFNVYSDYHYHWHQQVQEVIRNQTCVGMRHRDHTTTGSVDHGLSSSLLSYFFNKDGRKKLTHKEFLDFQRQLQREINRIEVGDAWDWQNQCLPSVNWVCTPFHCGEKKLTIESCSNFIGNYFQHSLGIWKLEPCLNWQIFTFQTIC